MRPLPLLLLSLIMAVLALDQARSADVDYGALGPFAVREVDASWTDPARQRDLPLRLRLPEAVGRRPTILFSHGLGGSRGGGAEWGEHWASHGFAVIHVQHPGSDESLWKDRPIGERLAGLKSGADLRQFLARIADIKFVVSELGRRKMAGDALASRVDLDRLGMSGHSFGAFTTFAVMACSQPLGTSPTGYCNSPFWTVTATSQLAPQTSVCTSCHDAPYTLAHALTNTTAPGLEACAACHGAGMAYDVAAFHGVP